MGIILNKQQAQPEINHEENIRFGGHMHILTNEVITHVMLVNNVKLYYQPYMNQTIRNLSNQYQNIKKQELNLKLQNFSLSLDIPLIMFTNQYQGQKKLSIFLNSLQSIDKLTEKQKTQLKQNLYELNMIWHQKGLLLKQNQYQPEIDIYLANCEQQIIKFKYKLDGSTTWKDLINFTIKRYNKHFDFKLQHYGITDKNHIILPKSCYNDKILRKRDLFSCALGIIIDFYPNNCYFKGLNQFIRVRPHSIHRLQINDMHQQRSSSFRSQAIEQTNKMHQPSSFRSQAIEQINKMHQQSSFRSQAIEQINYQRKSSITKTIHFLPTGPSQPTVPSNRNQSSKIYFTRSNKGANLSLEDVFKQRKSTELDILTFNFQSQQIQVTQIGPIHSFQQKQKISYIKVVSTLNQQSQPIILQCSPQTQLLTPSKQWIIAKNIKIGEQLYGINDKDSLICYRVIQNRIQDYQGIFYSLSSPKYNNIIINHLIAHNKNSITIKINKISKESQAIQQIEIYRDARLSEIFGDKRCQIIGNQLSNEANFGDYLFSNENIINVHQQQIQKQKNLIISIRNQYTINYTLLQDHQRETFGTKLMIDYLGLSKNKVISLAQRIQRSMLTINSNHMIVDKRGNLQFFNYIQNIEPIYRDFQDDSYHSYKYLVQPVQQRQGLNQKSYTAIKLYTQNDIYGNLNRFLYETYGRSQRNQIEYRLWFGMAGWISKSLKQLPDFEGVVYRGMKDISLQYYLGLVPGGSNQTVTLSSFTSASIDKNTANGFTNSGGCLITMKISKGKLIQKFSRYPWQRQVLLLPFTQFVIIDYDLQSRPQTATLEQLPMPTLASDKILYWVDDNPESNRSICRQIFEPKGIQVIEVRNTRVMTIVIKKYFWMLKIMDKKVVVISDMSRLQNGAWNHEAGAQLFYLIYNWYCLSNKAIIYTLDVRSAEEKLEKKGIPKGNWIISKFKEEVVAAALHYLLYD